MKLVMTLLVRDEEDIIRENIEFHLAQGVDFIIATDNLSVDSTTEILRSYEKQGVLHYIYEPEDNYNQHAWVTRMARMAHTDFGAGWVINNDADEFWWPEEGDLKSTFCNLPDEINILRVPRTNFVVVGNGELPFFEKMIYRESISLNPLGGPLPPKVAHRACSTVVVKQGNHSVAGLESQSVREGDIQILHFPVRSLEQLEHKIRMGGAAYARNTELPETVGNTWRSLFVELNEHDGLLRQFERNYYSEERLALALRSGTLIKDDRLAKFMRRIYSSI